MYGRRPPSTFAPSAAGGSVSLLLGGLGATPTSSTATTTRIAPSCTPVVPWAPFSISITQSFALPAGVQLHDIAKYRLADVAIIDMPADAAAVPLALALALAPNPSPSP